MTFPSLVNCRRRGGGFYFGWPAKAELVRKVGSASTDLRTIQLPGMDRSDLTADRVRTILPVRVVHPAERVPVLGVRVPTQTPAPVRVTVEVPPEAEDDRDQPANDRHLSDVAADPRPELVAVPAIRMPVVVGDTEKRDDHAAAVCHASSGERIPLLARPGRWVTVAPTSISSGCSDTVRG